MDTLKIGDDAMRVLAGNWEKVKLMDSGWEQL